MISNYYKKSHLGIETIYLSWIIFEMFTSSKWINIPFTAHNCNRNSIILVNICTWERETDTNISVYFNESWNLVEKCMRMLNTNRCNCCYWTTYGKYSKGCLATRDRVIRNYSATRRSETIQITKQLAVVFCNCQARCLMFIVINTLELLK